MNRVPQGSTAVGLVIVALIAISFLIFGVLLGPSKALTIASSSAAMTALDGFAEQPAASRLPFVEVNFDPNEFAAVLASKVGGDVNGSFMLAGSECKAVFSFDGPPSDHKKRSFRVAFKAPPISLPFHRIEIRNPSSADMLQDHMALWVAGEMGVVVPYDGLFVLRINGEELGVMEIREIIGPDLEQARGLSTRDIAVSGIGQQAVFPTSDSLSEARAGSLKRALNDTLLTAYARRDSIAMTLDVDAFLRYSAAVEVLRMNSAEHAWALGSRSGTFYPVMCSASIMEDRLDSNSDTTLISPMSQLLQLVANEPEWTARKEQYINEAKTHLLNNDLFLDKWRQAEAGLIPSLLRDRSKHAHIIVGDADTYGYSIRRAVRTSATFRDKAVAFWRGTENSSQ
ncbi:MAG: hypothetical protein WAR83_09820 [Flavobacteriales bacterium]|nr:hypothetical protein [Flavobacteriales bacterium]